MTFPFPTLTVRDKCDVCNHRALVEVEIRPDRSNLLFCAHHYRAVKAHLPSSAQIVHDDRSTERTMK